MIKSSFIIAIIAKFYNYSHRQSEAKVCQEYLKIKQYNTLVKNRILTVEKYAIFFKNKSKNYKNVNFSEVEHFSGYF